MSNAPMAASATWQALLGSKVDCFGFIREMYS